MTTVFIAPDSSIANPTIDQVLANCINVDSRSEARAYRLAYQEWHRQRSSTIKKTDEVEDNNEIHWAYITAKITRTNMLSFIKRNVADHNRRERLIDLFDLKEAPVRPVHFERQIALA